MINDVHRALRPVDRARRICSSSSSIGCSTICSRRTARSYCGERTATSIAPRRDRRPAPGRRRSLLAHSSARGRPRREWRRSSSTPGRTRASPPPKALSRRGYSQPGGGAAVRRRGLSRDDRSALRAPVATVLRTRISSSWCRSPRSRRCGSATSRSTDEAAERRRLQDELVWRARSRRHSCRHACRRFPATNCTESTSPRAVSPATSTWSRSGPPSPAPHWRSDCVLMIADVAGKGITAALLAACLEALAAGPIAGGPAAGGDLCVRRPAALRPHQCRELRDRLPGGARAGERSGAATPTPDTIQRS